MTPLMYFSLAHFPSHPSAPPPSMSRWLPPNSSVQTSGGPICSASFPVGDPLGWEKGWTAVGDDKARTAGPSDSCIPGRVSALPIATDTLAVNVEDPKGH